MKKRQAGNGHGHSIRCGLMALLLLGCAAPLAAHVIPFEEDDTLEEIRGKIEHNGYRFTVNTNRFSSMTPEARRAMLGGRAWEGPEPAPAVRFKTRRAEDLPSAYNLTNLSGHTYIGPIRDQSLCGICWIFGSLAAAESAFNLVRGRYDGQCVDFSEQYAMDCYSMPDSPYRHIGAYGCEGGAHWVAAERLVTYGVTEETNAPYEMMQLDWERHMGKPLTRFKSWGSLPVNDIPAIKTAIMTYGAVAARVTVSSAFMLYSGGIFEDANTNADLSPCNHVVALVGWDENSGDGYWILRNSWNTDWGEGGYMRIKYTSAHAAGGVIYIEYGTNEVPAVPVCLSASDGAYTNQVHLTWWAADGADGYQIFRDNGADTNDAVQIGTAASTNFEDTSAVAGTMYNYWLKSTNACGISGFSYFQDSGWRASPTGAIGVLPPILSYAVAYGGGNPAAQSLVVTNSSAIGFDFTNSTTYSAAASGWWQATPGTGSVTAFAALELTGTVDVAGLNAGMYYANSMIVSPEADNSPYSLVVALTVNKGDQIITFPTIPNQVVTNTVGLSATASSGLPVFLRVVSGPAVLDGTNLSFTGAGVVNVKATQDGNTNWNATSQYNVFRVFGLYTLTIESAHGTCRPAVGIYTNVEDSVLTNTVTGVEPHGNTQYVCTGWVGSGSVPPEGDTTNCSFTIADDSVLAWLWTTNYWLASTSGPHGSVTVPSGWQAARATTAIMAAADGYYHFTNWTGDVSGPDVQANPLNLLMDAPKAVTAHFAENLTTNTGTPEWWLAQYGLTNDGVSFEQAAAGDTDQDGKAAWEEYVAGTDPTNRASVFGIHDVEVSGTVIEIAWPSVSGRLYAVFYATNLPAEDFTLLGTASNLPATPDMNTYTNTKDTNARVLFYRIGVRKELEQDR